MIYLIPRIKNGVDDGAYLLTPKSGVRIVPTGAVWAADNQVFTGNYDELSFYAWLEKMKSQQSKCLFVASPDVVGDKDATIDLYHKHHERIRGMGYRVALVAQDGLDYIPSPTPDCLFIGGSTGWKEGRQALDLVVRAKAAGLWVHIGRVNSWRRFKKFADAGADSCDGTYPIFGDPNVGHVKSWQLRQRSQGRMFG